MFRITPLDAWHLKSVLAEPINAGIRSGFTFDYIHNVIMKTKSYTAFADDDILLCGGVTEQWHGRGHAWMVLSQNIKKHPVTFFRSMKRYMEESAWNRIEIDQEVGFDHGHRRFMMMGFELEVPRAKKYYANGKDASLYVWVRK